MDQEKIIQHVADILNIDTTGAKDFLSSITTSDLTTLVSDLESNNTQSIENLFNDYKSSFDFNDELEVEGYDESINEMDDIDNEYAIRKSYDDLKRKGQSHDEAANRVKFDFNLNDQELNQALKGPMTEYTNSFDAQINEVLNKIELLKKGQTQVGGNMFKGLSTDQVDQIKIKSLPSVSKVIGKVKKLNAMDTMESYANARGYDTVGLTEHELDIDTMQDFIIECELIKMFEAMKNKWHKRMYWRSRPKNIGLGTVGHADFDHEAKMDPDDKIEVDDFGTIKVKELKDYIVKQGKK